MSEIESGELIVVSKLNAIEIFTGTEGIKKILSEIENKVAAFVPDVSTVKGRKEIASLAYKVSQSKVILDDLGKGLVTDWKAKSALVDAARKIARDSLDALRDKAREPLTNWEEAEEKRIAAEKAAKELEDAETAARVEHALWLRTKEIKAKEAELARLENERIAKEAAELAEKEAKEKAELLEQARKENEIRIRKEEAERVKKEAEEAAAVAIREAERKAEEAQAAVEKAKRDRIAAEEKAKADQAAAVAAAEERARIEAAKIEADRIAREAAEKAKLEAERKEAERKAADIEHRRSINRDVLDGLVSTGVTEDQAKNIITAIVGGMIKHISIKY